MSLSLTCYQPVVLYQDPIRHQGPFKVPCGKCLACLRKRSLDWTTRCIFESRVYGADDCCFVTLTYAEAPEQGLVKRHLQCYLKRLRSRLYPLRIRFYACGEYGSIGKRPHYHMILFGVSADVLSCCDDAWPFGFVSVGRATERSIAYTCGYCNKSRSWPSGKTPCFRIMSRRPGLGLSYYLSNAKEIDRLYDILPRYFEERRYPVGSVEREVHKEWKLRFLQELFRKDLQYSRDTGLNVLSVERYRNLQNRRDHEAVSSLLGGKL